MTRRRLIVVIPVALFVVTLSLGVVFLNDVLATTGNIYNDIALFNKVLNLVQTYYVEEMPSDSLIQGAIIGMLDQLDPHSNYIPPERFAQMEERNRGSYSGVGISFAIIKGWLTVVSPLEGGPSERLGIRPGDVISHIEGESAYGIKENEVFEKLRGPRGTTVHVTIRRGHEPEPLEYDIVRDEILIESVGYAFMLTPEIGYVRMSRFSAQTSEELEDALASLDAQGMTGLVLDLRGNSGGYLNQAVEVTNKFLDSGKMIVYTKGRIVGSSEEYYATESGHVTYPLVVLINRGSASASEIVSGAVQDWDRGLVAGTTSFGKGLVQRQYQLPNDGAVLLTVARYYTPSGRLIQRPYEAGDREGYYEQAGDGAGAPGSRDSTAAEPDTTAPRPLHRTMVQSRPVYGGGGISPDVEIHEPQMVSVLGARLSNARKFFEFINDAIAENKVRWDGSFEEFVQGYAVNDALLDDFRAWLTADAFEFEPDSLVTRKDEMRRWLRSEVAQHYWGDDARYQVLIAADPVVVRAVELMPQAAALLTETRRIELQKAQSN